jgi:alpha-tubulin suppressor-like RCC1 family protein/tRNA A-37 threonylcarbamoyl transferase component Bud32
MNDQVRQLFHELADMPPEERERVFAAQGVSTELRAEVQSLLTFDSGGESVTACVGRAAEALLNSSGSIEADEYCGPYRLIRLLGSGGMGAVYFAERTDGEIQQRVAIKVLRPGAERSSWQERFLRERQILANLNHPGIARLLDAGHTANGQPYIVMEYLDGTPIDEYAASLTLRAKLKLFLEVSEAVSYAHRNLIIHRDLKPSNILVGADGRPKLLDFGIAKIMEAGLDQTQTREVLLTPAFASPEQIRGQAQTTSGDVYSLGAVLYALVTGQSPHAAGPVWETDAAPASRLNRDLPRDIDFILGKALRNEPEERYPSVEAFAEDVRAFLEWRPVRARSGDVWYRTRKFVRRYRVLVAAAILTVTGLSAGLYVANRERALAERRFLQVRQMATKWIDLDQDIRALRNSLPARKRIISTALEYLARIGAEAGGDRDLALEMAAAYLQVARLQGVPEESNVGQFAEAELSLRKADALADAALSAAPRDPRALGIAARIAYNRMALASFQDRYQDELTHASKVIARLDELSGAKAAVPDYNVLFEEAKRHSTQAEASLRTGADPFRPPAVSSPPTFAGGQLRAWGYNEYGQLGIGTFADAVTPGAAGGPAFTSIATGWVHSLALRSDGTVWAWGRSSNGQLGLGSLTSSAVPRRVPRLGRVVTIASGFDHSFAIDSEGAAWAWGANFTGQLGIGSKADSTLPVRIPGLSHVVSIDGGGAHSIAALADGTVWTWGYNSNGQLGASTGDTTHPVQVRGLSGVTAVAAGGAFSLALKSDGTVWGWGMNWSGQLGDGSNSDTVSPVRAAGLTRIVAIAAGDAYTLALKADGTVWAWGDGKEGELGIGPYVTARVPMRITGLSDVVAVSASSHQRVGHSLAVKADGSVWAWGANWSGQLGNGNTADSNVPIQVPGIRNAAQVSAGGSHSLVLVRPDSSSRAQIPTK